MSVAEAAASHVGSALAGVLGFSGREDVLGVLLTFGCVVIWVWNARLYLDDRRSGLKLADEHSE